MYYSQACCLRSCLCFCFPPCLILSSRYLFIHVSGQPQVLHMLDKFCHWAQSILKHGLLRCIGWPGTFDLPASASSAGMACVHCHAWHDEILCYWSELYKYNSEYEVGSDTVRPTLKATLVSKCLMQRHFQVFFSPLLRQRLVFPVLGIKSRASYLIRKCFTIQLHPQPLCLEIRFHVAQVSSASTYQVLKLWNYGFLGCVGEGVC